MRETFGAVLAMHQAERATDPVIRRAMRCIAEDETRHAALSWRLAAWISVRLDAPARRRVAAAVMGAADAIAHEASLEPARDRRVCAGLPTGEDSARLVTTLGTALWQRKAWLESEAFPEAS